MEIARRGWKLLALMVMAFVLLREVRMVHGQRQTPGQCKEEIRLATNACRPIVFGQPPSPACCVRVRASNLECVCPMFTPKLVTLININQVIKLFQTCRRRVPRRFKCGSLNFP